MSVELVLFFAAVVVVYLVTVFVFPRTRCRRCASTGGAVGRNHQPFFPTRNFRKCRKCKGLGWHVRPMRRFLGGRNKMDGSGVWQGP